MAEFGLYTDPYYQDVVEDNLPKQIVHKTDHTQEGLARLIHQYADKPRIKLLLQIYLDQIQTCENAIFSLIDNANLDNATGWLLAALGKILVQPNPGLSDANYRTLLRARVKVLRSDGKPEELLTILRLILNDVPEDADIEINEFTTIGLLIKIRSSLGSLDSDLVASLLRDAHAGGVPLQVIFSSEATSTRFSFAPGATSVTGSATGFASAVTPGTGGVLSSVR